MLDVLTIAGEAIDAARACVFSVKASLEEAAIP
jgi:hypothetical protein